MLTTYYKILTNFLKGLEQTLTGLIDSDQVDLEVYIAQIDFVKAFDSIETLKWLYNNIYSSVWVGNNVFSLPYHSPYDKDARFR